MAFADRTCGNCVAVDYRRFGRKDWAIPPFLAQIGFGRSRQVDLDILPFSYFYVLDPATTPAKHTRIQADLHHQAAYFTF